ncbi:MAG: pilus assembly protein [Actinobacteria bacterium]|nr:pilus assembly protein [Actinomycetota bacterium]
MRRRWARRARGEGGAALVELAFVAMILSLLAAGGYDYGMGYRAGLGVIEGTRTGARVGSSIGNDIQADFQILSSSKSALQSSGLLPYVEKVVIYRSTNVNGDIPNNCKNYTSGSVNDYCNIFMGDDFRNLPATWSSSIADGNGCLDIDRNARWCPTARKDIQAYAEYVGVWIQIKYPYQFRMLGSTITINKDSVMRIEPTDG